MHQHAKTISISLQLHQGGSQVQMHLPTKTTISDIKDTLRLNKGMHNRNYDIIFCGRVMKDHENLESYNITSATTLHVVDNLNTSDTSATSSIMPCKLPFLTGIWMHRLWNSPLQTLKLSAENIDHTKDMIWPRYYAYCKLCIKVVASKLRVRCGNCNEDTITLNRDPQDWIDVIRPGQITGNCHSNECKGDICDADFYFKCCACAEEASVVPLPNVASNINQSLCLTCLDCDHPVINFPCYPDHVMCLSCFEQYARTKLRERSMVLHNDVGYTLACPDGCTDSYLSDMHIMHILGNDEYQLYQFYAAEECLTSSIDGIVCPNPRCCAGLFGNSLPHESNIRVSCPSCKSDFCSNCRRDYHGTTNCAVALTSQATGSKAAEEYLDSVRMIERIAKKCPGCGSATERNGGCMHMTCRVCNFEWCWNCVAEWNTQCQMDHWFA